MPVRDKNNFLIFGSPDIGEAEIGEVVSSMRSGWLGTGRKVQRFEEDFKAYKEAENAVAVNSCTAALHLSMLASGIGHGDEVITTAMTFCATVNAIIHSGATPVLADCDPVTHCMDPHSVRGKITQRTKAVLPVHFAGRPCDMDAIMAIATEYKLKVIEDCAHAIETTYKGRHVGTFGDFGCFSFYVTKNVVTGEGGMVLTKRKKDADKIKILALHGMTKDAWRRFSDDGYRHYEVIHAGFKYNMMDLQAAIGIHQLGRIETNWKRREVIWRRYMEELKPLPLRLPAEPPPQGKHAYHLFTILLDKKDSEIERDEFLSAMNDENIGCGVHYMSIPTHSYYRKTFSWDPEDYPNSYLIGRQTVSLPLSSKLSDNDVGDVITASRKILAGGVRLSAPMSHLFKDDSGSKDIEERVYCLECREDSIESVKSNQQMFHFDRNIVKSWQKDEKDLIGSAIISKRDLKLITFHVSASCDSPVLRGGMYHSGGAEFSRQEMLANARDNIGWLKALVKDRDIKIAAENNNYYPTSAYRYITDADFISQLIYENGLWFLFDLAHAKITVHNKKEPNRDYISALPMDRMIQIHVSKHGVDEHGMAYDAHDMPDELIFQEVEEIVRKFWPRYLTIEYYKDKDSLIRILERYRKLCVLNPEKQTV